jgi:5-methylcytosine-specific restriction endonuclease McrA
MPSKPQVFRPAHLGPRLTKRQVFDALDARRGSSAQRGYGSKWQKARDAYIAAHPWCACGCGGLATVLDHIVPHRGDMKLFWNPSNWQGLTVRCHARKSPFDVLLPAKG